jgi:hypothetical protein
VQEADVYLHKTVASIIKKANTEDKLYNAASISLLKLDGL